MGKTLFVWLLLVTLMITIPVFAAPPSAPTPVGAGSGDFSGPASATDGNFVSFDGAGGKTGKDSGSKAADFLGASAKAPDAANVTVNQDGQDLLGGKGTNLIHATLTYDVFPYSTFMSKDRLPMITGTITYAVTGQITASANWTTELQFGR